MGGASQACGGSRRCLTSAEIYPAKTCIKVCTTKIITKCASITSMIQPCSNFRCRKAINQYVYGASPACGGSRCPIPTQPYSAGEGWVHLSYFCYTYYIFAYPATALGRVRNISTIQNQNLVSASGANI